MSTTFDPNYIQPKDYVLLSIKVLVQNPEDKILLLHRSKLSGGRRAWDFCGGATEKKRILYKQPQEKPKKKQE